MPLRKLGKQPPQLCKTVGIEAFQDWGFFSFFIVPLEAFLENSNLAQIVLLTISKYTMILARNPEG